MNLIVVVAASVTSETHDGMYDYKRNIIRPYTLSLLAPPVALHWLVPAVFCLAVPKSRARMSISGGEGISALTLAQEFPQVADAHPLHR